MNNQGITKIEILIIGLIVGLLGVMAVVAVSTARSRTRDAVRLSDVRQTQAALELYFNDNNNYPEQVDYLAIGQASTICLSEGGFVATCSPQTQAVYLEIVPTAPTSGLKGLSTCSEVKNAYCYLGSDGEYRLQFEMENKNPLLGLQKGLNCATQGGLQSGSCAALTFTPAP